MFWKKFLRFFSVGFSIILLISFVSSISFAEITQRGPKTVAAIGECEGGYRNFGGNNWYPDSTCDDSSYQNPYQAPGQAPAQVPGQAPQPLQPKQPEPQCVPNPRYYNECAGSDKPGLSYRIWTDDCGNFRQEGSQADAACGPVLQPIPQPTYQPQPQPQPAPQPIYQPVVQPQAPICIPQNVSMSVNPNPIQSGGTVTLNVSGSEGSTWIDDKVVDQNGQTVLSGGFWGGRSLGPLNSGNYTWTHYYRNTAPNNPNITSDLCQKSTTFSVNQPTPTPVPTPTPAPVVQVSCPAISWNIPSGIQPNQTVPVTVNTSGGQNWNNVTLYMNGQRVSGGGQNGGSFTWNVNSGNAGSQNNFEFRVNDGSAYGTNQQPLSCGVISFTTATPVVIPTPTPAPRGGTELRCPAGTVQTLEGNTIICIQNINNNVNNNQNTQTQIVNVPAAQVIGREVYVATPTAQPKIITVAASEVQTLPKTGLPLAGIALGGLLPIGMRLRRIGKAKDIISANSIWEQRQFQI